MQLFPALVGPTSINPKEFKSDCLSVAAANAAQMLNTIALEYLALAAIVFFQPASDPRISRCCRYEDNGDTIRVERFLRMTLNLNETNEPSACHPKSLTRSSRTAVFASLQS